MPPNDPCPDLGTMKTTAEIEVERQKQIRSAEELLFTGPQKLGVAKGLFAGQFVANWVMPYPKLPADQRDRLEAALPEIVRFLDEKLDAEAIDRQADIPRQ